MAGVTVQQVSRQIKVSQARREIKVRQVDHVIEVVTVGRRGPQGIQGIQGVAGEGLPTGGETGEFLVKESNADYDYDWTLIAPTGDKNFTYDFTNLSVVTVDHGLNKYPSVTVIDSTGDEVWGNVDYTTINQVVVSFSASFTGRITCN